MATIAALGAVLRQGVADLQQQLGHLLRLDRGGQGKMGGKSTGKPSKTIGKPWENGDFMVISMGKALVDHGKWENGWKMFW